VTITAAADGSALGNPGPAGWAWYIDEDRWDAGGWKHGTNNMGELKAVLELFHATSGVDDDLLVLCDSQYVINSVTKWMPGWKRKGWRKADGKPVMNVELLKELDEAIAGRRYRFEWVKGHVGHELNEAADERARAVATAYQRGAAIPSGPGFGVAPSPRPAQPALATPVDAAPRVAPPSLFDIADAASGTPGSRSVTVELPEDEWARLERRARRAGISPEQLLRELAARA
jgi:ribonuclease HI